MEAIVADLDTRRHDFHVAIENWQHDFNIGTIVRTANAFLAREVHIVGNRRWNRRGAMVTDRYQHVRHHPDVADARRAPARADGVVAARHRQPAGLGAARDPGRCRGGCACCSARRGRGSPTQARAACDGTFSIAQFGSTRSINASAAAAIAMHTWVRAARRPRRVLARLSRSIPGSGRLAGDRRGLLESRRHRHAPADHRRRPPMPIATPEVYAEMLDKAKRESASPTRPSTSRSSQTLNAALQGFAEAGSDGIIQVSTGGAEYLSGPTVKNMVTGSVAFAAYAAEVAKNYPVNIALHTDHCPKDKLDGFVRPLLDISIERVKNGQAPAVPVAHVGRLGGAARREPADRPGAARPRRPPRRSSSRSRSASSAARRTASRAASTTSSTPPPRTRWPRSRRSASARRAAT